MPDVKRTGERANGRRLAASKEFAFVRNVDGLLEVGWGVGPRTIVISRSVHLCLLLSRCFCFSLVSFFPFSKFAAETIDTWVAVAVVVGLPLWLAVRPFLAISV